MTTNKIPYPIVLCPGVARFDALLNPFVTILHRYVTALDRWTDKVTYFRNVRTHLEAQGFEVYNAKVSFAGSVEQRGRELKQEVLDALYDSSAEKAHLVAHSMGGLDARHMIVDEGMDWAVSSLTTIGTPHLGTSFADWGLEHNGDAAIKWLEKVLDLRGLLDLTQESCATFNARAEASEAANAVHYETWASSQDELEAVFQPLKASWKIIMQREGSNDGLVSRASQFWHPTLVRPLFIPPSRNPFGYAESARLGYANRKQITWHPFPFPADHFNECGWWERGEKESRKAFEQKVLGVYLEIANRCGVIEGLQAKGIV